LVIAGFTRIHAATDRRCLDKRGIGAVAALIAALHDDIARRAVLLISPTSGIVRYRAEGPFCKFAEWSRTAGRGSSTALISRRSTVA
jgi:hypothetical protein